MYMVTIKRYHYKVIIVIKSTTNLSVAQLSTMYVIIHIIRILFITIFYDKTDKVVPFSQTILVMLLLLFAFIMYVQNIKVLLAFYMCTVISSCNIRNPVSCCSTSDMLFFQPLPSHYSPALLGIVEALLVKTPDERPR